MERDGLDVDRAGKKRKREGDRERDEYVEKKKDRGSISL